MSEGEITKLNAQDIADFFLSKRSLSPKKIQKLVYYAYAWYITLYNQDAGSIEQTLFEEEPEAWMHGPVFPSLYREYKDYGWRDVPKKLFSKNKISDKGTVDFLNDVWEKYGDFTADQLEFMTHQEDPWKKARAGTQEFASSKAKIDKKDIYEFYNRQALML